MINCDVNSNKFKINIYIYILYKKTKPIIINKMSAVRVKNSKKSNNCKKLKSTKNNKLTKEKYLLVNHMLIIYLKVYYIMYIILNIN